MYFITKNYIVHTVPFFCTLMNLFISYVIFLESDWFLMPSLSICYLVANFAISKYAGKERVYILNWTNEDTITYIEFLPFIIMCGYMLALLATHYMTCITT